MSCENDEGLSRPPVNKVVVKTASPRHGHIFLSHLQTHQYALIKNRYQWDRDLRSQVFQDSVVNEESSSNGGVSGGAQPPTRYQ